jgi:hypothetical protein
MVKKLTLGEVTVAQLRHAAVILATDPRDPTYQHLLWGHELPQAGTLHVQLDSNQPPELQRLLSLVESAKGSLTQSGRNLRSHGSLPG